MIVEFKTVRCSLEENFNREKQVEVQGEMSLEFFRQDDYMSTTTVEMDDVIDYDVATAYLNDVKFECVYARIGEETWTRNLIITGDEFKAILEHARDIKVRDAEDILKKIKNENHSTSI